ncbi:MAG: cytochrome c [Saprospiraceae bacterium]|nr:cytochrome c [Lewinellaceae bacterium]
MTHSAAVKPSALFRVVFPSLLVASLYVACGSESNSRSVAKTTEKPKATTQTATAIDGAAVFRLYCVTCHGADGKLGLNGAGDLTKSALTLEERVTQISKGKNMMTAFEEILSPEEIRAVAEFTLSLKK